MTKTLYLHIGHYKTGTTALQVFLARNPRFLARHGTEYCELHLHNAKHSHLAFALLREAGAERLMHGYCDPTPPADLWADLMAHVRASPARKVIVSSEEFMRLGEFPAAADRLAELAATAGNIDIRVIAYLRNPRDHLRSWHNQLVKMGVEVGDIAAAMQSGAIEAVHYDYARALTPWLAAFGPDRVVLRDYDRARRRRTGLYQDFFSVLGLPWQEGLAEPEDDPNPRLDDRMVDLIRLLQNAGLPPFQIEATKKQLQAWLATQDAHGTGGAGAMAAARAAAQAGIEAIATLPHVDLDLERMAAGLPEDEDPALRDQRLLTGFVLGEFLQQRRRSNRSQQGLVRRLRALEALAGIGPGARTGGEDEGEDDTDDIGA